MDKVNLWLESIALQQYGENFEKEGWDDMDTITSMSEDDVKTVVDKPGHVRKVLRAIHRLNNETQRQEVSRSGSILEETATSEVKETSQGGATVSMLYQGIIGTSTSYQSTKKGQAIQRKTLERHDSAIQHIVKTQSQSEKVEISESRQLSLNERNRVSLPNKTDHSLISENQMAVNTASKQDMSTVSVLNHETIGLSHGTIMARSEMPVCTSNTIVKDSKNITIAETVQIINAEQPDEGTNFQSQINSCLKKYNERKSLFVKTTAYEAAMDIVDDRNWVVVIGNPGDGKSTIAHQLLLDHQKKGHAVVLVISTHDWKQMVVGKGNDSQKQIVLIDDMFGVSSVNDTAVNDWLCLLEVMGSVVSERKGRLKVVCTSRKTIYNQVVNKVTKFKEFGMLGIVDLCTKPNSLSKQEKVRILTTYFKYYEKQFETSYTSDIESIASIDLNYGFPLCVEIFCTNSIIRKQGINFFRFPIKLVQNEIEECQVHDKKKFCALLLVLLSRENRVCLERLDDTSGTFTDCLELSGLSTTKNKYALREAFIGLENVYLKLEDQTYSFKHDSFKEILAWHVAKSCPKRAIQMLDLDFLVNRTELLDSDISQSELKIGFSLTNAKELSERWTAEILNGNMFKVLKHKSWYDVTFQTCWLEIASTAELPDDSLLSKCLNLKIVQTIIGRKWSFLECLAYFRNETLLIRILSLPTINSYVTKDSLRTQTTEALLYSTFHQLSSKLLQMLIDAGADVNYNFGYKATHETLNWGFWPFGPIITPNGTALMHAVHTKNLENTKVLLRNGANLFDVDGEGLNLFDLAVGCNATSVLEFLYKTAQHRDSQRTRTEANCTKKVCISYFLEIDYQLFFTKGIKVLPKSEEISKIIKQHCTETHWPGHDFYFSHTWLLRDANKRTPLNLTGTKPDQHRLNQMSEILLSSRPLPSRICDVPIGLINETFCNKYDEQGKIPIFHALELASQIDNQLLDTLFAKSDVTLKDMYQRNCLHFIAQSPSYSKCNEHVKKLLEMGVDINALDDHGNVPVAYSSSFETLEIFHKNGSTFDLKNVSGANVLMQILLQNANDIIEKVSFVLEHLEDADVQNVDVEGKTLLHYVVNTSYTFEVQKTVFDLLLKRGCAACTCNAKLKSVLLWHLQNPKCSVNIVKLLMSNGKHMFPSPNDVTEFLRSLSDSHLSTDRRVECLLAFQDCQKADFGNELLREFLIWPNIDKGACEQMLSVIQNRSNFEEMLSMTLSSENSDRVKFHLIKALTKNPSFEINGYVKGLLNLNTRLELLSNPKCLLLLRHHGLKIESVSIDTLHLEKIINDNNKLVKAFRGYLRQGFDLKSILSAMQISVLANLFARIGCFKSLSALLKACKSVVDFTVVDDCGNTILHNVSSKHAQICERDFMTICSSSLDVNAVNRNNETPLFIACSLKKPDLRKIVCLLKNGGNINQNGSSGTTPLHLLMKRLEDIPKHNLEEFCREIGKIGVALDRLDNYGLTPIMYLICYAKSNKLYHVLTQLLEHKMSVSVVDIDGRCLLHYIAMSQFEDGLKAHLCKILIDKGVRTTSKDIQRRYPIDQTLFSKTSSIKLCKELSHSVPKENIAQCLLNNIENITDTSMEEILCQQLTEQSISLNWQDVSGATFLSLACRFGNARLVDKLLGMGADPNTSDVLGHSALFLLLFSETAIDISFWFCRCFAFDLMEELRFHARGNFPWFVCSKSAFLKLQKSFMGQRGSNFPLHNEIIQRINTYLKIAQTLFDHGADPNQLDIFGKTALHYCAEAPLLDSVVCPLMEILIDHGGNVDSEDFEGRTPLMLCAAHKRTKYRRMNILIKAGADLFCRDYNGRTTHDYTKLFLKYWLCKDL